MELIKKWVKVGNICRPFSIDIIRIYIGIGLILKGINFIMNPDQLGAWLQQGNLNDVAGLSFFQIQQVLILYFVITVHTFGGFLLTIGLLTRLSALAQVPVLLGAIFVVHIHEGAFTMSQNLEFTTLLLFLLIMIVLNGSEKFSVDVQLKKVLEKLSKIDPEEN